MSNLKRSVWQIAFYLYIKRICEKGNFTWKLTPNKIQNRTINETSLMLWIYQVNWGRYQAVLLCKFKICNRIKLRVETLKIMIKKIWLQIIEVIKPVLHQFINVKLLKKKNSCKEQKDNKNRKKEVYTFKKSNGIQKMYMWINSSKKGNRGFVQKIVWFLICKFINTNLIITFIAEK